MERRGLIMCKKILIPQAKDENIIILKMNFFSISKGIIKVIFTEGITGGEKDIKRIKKNFLENANNSEKE